MTNYVESLPQDSLAHYKQDRIKALVGSGHFLDICRTKKYLRVNFLYFVFRMPNFPYLDFIFSLIRGLIYTHF